MDRPWGIGDGDYEKPKPKATLGTAAEWTPSPDQVKALDGIMAWQKNNDGVEVLTIGGYAGCLSGDTALEYNRGSRVNTRPISLREMYLKFNGQAGSGRGMAQRWDPSIKTFLHSLWPDGTVSRNQVVAVLESGVKPVIRLSFSNGQSLVLTRDHPVATPSGEFIEAGALVAGDLVLARGSMLASPSPGKRPLSLRPPRIVVNTKYHPGPEKIVTCNGVSYSYVRVARARLVVEAGINNLPYDVFLQALKHDATASARFTYLPQDVDVHHKDGDALNDNPSNLEVLSHADHAREHAAEAALNLDYTRELTVTETSDAGEDMTYDIQMSSPANNFVANGVFVHNTGKTALTGRVAYDLISAGVDIAFATPTGKAAQVLTRSLARSGVLDAPVSTIHSLIYKPVEDKKTGRVIGWEPRRRLDCQLIVVDEASMISQDVLKHLRNFGIPILAVGDHGQLPPVGESTGLMTKPDFRLEKIHRQATGNPIIRLSTLVRNGAPNDALKKFIDDINDPRVGYTRSRDQAIEFAAPPGLLLTYTNKLRSNLNRDIRHDLHGYGEETDPQPGEVVICLKNKRLDDGGRMIANGARGTVRACKEGNSRHVYSMDVEFDEPVGLVQGIEVCKHQFLRDKTFAGFDEVPGNHSSWWSVGALFDFGYSMTCHKSQGSQADKVAVFMEWALSKMEEADRRRWIYTAITRAVDSVLLVF
jgi:exodeoxyribonuclease-5